MKATGSPTWRTWPSARIGCGDVGAGGAVAVLELHRRVHRLDAVGLEVVARVDGEHARHRPGGRGVDRDDPRRRMRGAQQDPDRGVGEADVVGVAPVALQEAGVLDASDGLGETEFGGHGAVLFPGCILAARSMDAGARQAKGAGDGGGGSCCGGGSRRPQRAFVFSRMVWNTT